MNTDCKCVLAGYCERHKVKKAIRMVELCKQGNEYWEAWESGKGPGQIVSDDISIQTDQSPIKSTGTGPGTILHNYLEKIGIKVTSTCSCSSYQNAMDGWGPEGCKTKIPIIVDWLREEARLRKLPFVTLAATLLVRWVIHQSEKSIKNSEKLLDTETPTS